MTIVDFALLALLLCLLSLLKRFGLDLCALLPINTR